MRPLSLLPLLLASLPSWAQRPLTLAEAQAEARAHAPEAGELEARVRGARVLEHEAGRAVRLDPSISAVFRTNALGGEADERGFEVGLDWPVDLSGAWVPARESAAAEREQASHRRVDGLRELDEAVAIAAAEVALRARLVARARTTAELWALAASATRRQLEVGEGNQLDVDAADLDLQSARADLYRAEGDLDRARAVLARLLGRPPAASEGLVVADPAEATDVPPPSSATRRRSSDPRLRAARAEVRAAELELQAESRRVWPVPTLGVEYARRASEVPSGSFAEDPLLEARWVDAEVGVGLTLPLPLFDRRTEPRARATARRIEAAARARTLEATVLAGAHASWLAFRAAARALEALQGTPAILEREIDLVGRAVRAGALDAVARAQALRRLEESGRRWDMAVYDLRVARARWNRAVAR